MVKGHLTIKVDHTWIQDFEKGRDSTGHKMAGYANYGW